MSVNNSSSVLSPSSAVPFPSHFATVSPHFSLFFGSLIAFVTFVGVLANAFVVVAVAGDKKMRRSPMNLLLLNLAVADLLYLLAFTPFWASMSVHGDGGWHFPESFCPIGRYLSNCLLIVSIFTYVAICVERFVAIVHPMHAQVWCTRSRALLAVLGLWTFVMAYQLPYLALFQTQPAPWNVEMRICRSRLAGKSSLWRAYKWSEFVLTYALPVLLSASLYARICRVLWAKSAILQNNVPKRSAIIGTASTTMAVPPATYRPNGTIRRVLETKLVNGISKVAPIKSTTAAAQKPQKGSQKSSSSSAANDKARRNVVKMLMVCVTLFFLCYTPMVVYFLWGALFGRPLPLPFEFVFLTSTFVQFQSAFNPFLYTLFATKFREKLAKLVKRKQKQRKDNLRDKNEQKAEGREEEGEKMEQNGHKASGKSSISSLGGGV
ncbi:hypothetical protein niasHT_037544 [Heterodera trifolii]|uniref:G-protein coupled receptors family 1 profile domain-containing protein n=1 Tax=Heterodera trifolii TaxID=157864 RepID=A0ABD2IPE7_9BILA